MTNHETSFEDPDFIQLNDGRTDFGPDSGVGLEGTLVNPYEVEEHIKDLNRRVGSFVLSNLDKE